jgi:two-component system sensor histidine kinase TctE
MNTSLQLRLLYPLLWLWVASATTTALTGYGLVEKETNQTFDRILADDARALASQVHWVAHQPEFTLDDHMASSLIYDSLAPSNYSVRKQSGAVLVGDARLVPPALPAGHDPAQPVFSNLDLGGRNLRLVSMRVSQPLSQDDVWVMVAEDQSKREHLRSELAKAIFGPAFLIGFVVLPLLVLGVRYGLRLASRTSADVEARSLNDLSPLPLDGVPQELRSLVQRINELLARLKATLALERQFIAEAAHQLRTPVTGIRLLTQDLIRTQLRQPGAAPDAEVLRELDSSAHKATHLVQQMLSLARAEAGAGGQRQKVAFQDFVQSLLDPWQKAARQRGKEIQIESLDVHAWVWVDPQVLQDACNNLIENALLHGGPHCRLSLMADTESVRFVLSDDGAPLSDETLASIKKPFWRGPEGQATGSGLGLAIAEKAAWAFGGRLELGRASPEGGLRVSLQLPLTPAPDQSLA